MSTIAKQNYRGAYHVSPQTNWMNDPNGMVYFEGEYHLFFQHHPNGDTWGPMHWGHVVSTDLVTWEELDIALAPDELGTIFSGSAVVDWNNTTGFFDQGDPGLVAIFTHHLEEAGRPVIQRQSLAYSKDKGRTWVKYAGNPVLEHESFVDFRDPKVFWHEQSSRWAMIIACGQTVCLYHSADLKSWNFGSEFGSGIGSHDGVWECPDLFPLALDGDPANVKWVMLVSIGADPAFAEGSRTQYFTGDFDGVTFTPDAASMQVRWADHGRDNYAGVTWSDVPAEDGRRLFIGWMSNWQYANQTPTEGFRGAMTIPRELTLETINGKPSLMQKPAYELENARKQVLAMENSSAAQVSEALRSLQLVSYEIHAQLPAGQSLGFKVRAGASDETVVGIDASAIQTIYADRMNSGQHSFHALFRSVNSAAITPAGESVELRIFVDAGSVEVFGNEGEAAITNLIYPDADATGVSFFSADSELIIPSLRIYELAPLAAN
ncbi:glycoside hydrolase family 32 protein [Paenibacillus sp. NEAU-GSW1]|uniref:glycoside hydrolase family 32 protein n=1 Tax=Paenibacillus sp. NEAU-GSW1 TaxID=2682486 RepID=UPI0012E29E68|nr:glycoside hydrolase family 32 protein [Paenibacillus sp. NEAU-GSW1]MUT65790.1 glycoside hydrolase family 32 protein [Paenibacillus sp. NEAU-GSW1]